MNGSAKRKFFDTVTRDAVDRCLGPDILIAGDCSVFEMSLNLETSSMTQAIRVENRVGVPKRFDSVHVVAEFETDVNRLIIRTPSLVAVDQAIRIFLCSGGHLILTGSRGCGKTMAISDVLADLRKNSPTPQQIRQNILDNLLDIISNRKQPEGVAASLGTMRHVLHKLDSEQPKHDDMTDLTSCWQVVQDGTKVKKNHRYMYYLFILIIYCYKL